MSIGPRGVESSKTYCGPRNLKSSAGRLIARLVLLAEGNWEGQHGSYLNQGLHADFFFFCVFFQVLRLYTTLRVMADLIACRYWLRRVGAAPLPIVTSSAAEKSANLRVLKLNLSASSEYP